MIKRRPVKLSDKDGDINKLFNQMIGIERANFGVAYPRWLKLHDLHLQMCKLIKIFRDTPFMKLSQTHCKQFDDFYENADKATNIYWNEKLKLQLIVATSSQINTVLNEELATEFDATYKMCKNSDIVKTYCGICKNIIPYGEELKKPVFLESTDANITPFPFSTITTKYILSIAGSDNNTQLLQYIGAILLKFLEISYEIYEMVSSPDIDIDEFIEIVKMAISKLRRIPEMSRCGDAFDIILNSVGLLKSKFNSYYKDYIESKNSSIIIENFISDVAQQNTGNIKLAGQFKKIIDYYQNNASEVAKKSGAFNSLINNVNKKLDSVTASK